MFVVYKSPPTSGPQARPARQKQHWYSVITFSPFRSGLSASTDCLIVVQVVSSRRHNAALVDNRARLIERNRIHFHQQDVPVLLRAPGSEFCLHLFIGERSEGAIFHSVRLSHCGNDCVTRVADFYATKAALESFVPLTPRPG